MDSLRTVRTIDGVLHRRFGVVLGSVALSAAIVVPVLGLPRPPASSADPGAGLACRTHEPAGGCPTSSDPEASGGATAALVVPTATFAVTPDPSGTLAITPGPSWAPHPTSTTGATALASESPRSTLAATQVPTPTTAAAEASKPTPKPTPIPTPTPTPIRTPTPTATPAPPLTWAAVVDDQFDSGGVPSHWTLYDGPYGSGAQNCADPSHVTVSGGAMHILMAYESSGSCGPGWYTGGMMVGDAYGSIDQRVTVRFRVVDAGVQGHYIIPMRWPDTAPWPSGGEEDFCESSDLAGCTTFLHYGSNNSQISADHAVDLSQWHTMQFTRLHHVVTAAIDGKVVWSYTGTSATLPDTVKRVVLQQECESSCPAGTSGSEDIQIDWITIEDPSS